MKSFLMSALLLVTAAVQPACGEIFIYSWVQTGKGVEYEAKPSVVDPNIIQGQAPISTTMTRKAFMILERNATQADTNPDIAFVYYFTQTDRNGRLRKFYEVQKGLKYRALLVEPNLAFNPMNRAATLDRPTLADPNTYTSLKSTRYTKDVFNAQAPATYCILQEQRRAVLNQNTTAGADLNKITGLTTTQTHLSLTRSFVVDTDETEEALGEHRTDFWTLRGGPSTAARGAATAPTKLSGNWHEAYIAYGGFPATGAPTPQDSFFQQASGTHSAVYDKTLSDAAAARTEANAIDKGVNAVVLRLESLGYFSAFFN